MAGQKDLVSPAGSVGASAYFVCRGLRRRPAPLETLRVPRFHFLHIQKTANTAKAVLAVREIYPQIKLILVLPCEDQARYWKAENVEEYNKIKEQADKIRYVSKSYYDGCIHKKNRHMVDCSSICVCFLTDFESGTAVTVDYAIEKGLDVINVADEFDDVL